MADLEPRVKQLEEDVTILKGEIKSVLMEVRTTLLSQSNPFTSASFVTPAPAPAAVPSPLHPPAAEPARQPEPQAPVSREEPRYDETPLQNINRNDLNA